MRGFAHNGEEPNSTDPSLILLTSRWWRIGFSHVLGMNFALVVRLGHSGRAEHHAA